MKKIIPKRISRKQMLDDAVELLLDFDNFELLEVLNTVFDARQPINDDTTNWDGAIRKHFHLSIAISCKKFGPEPQEWEPWTSVAVARIDQAAYSPDGFRSPDIAQSGMCAHCGVELYGIAKSSICPVCGAKAYLT